MAHTTLGVKISAPKGYLKLIVEGLAIIYKICKMSKLLGSSCNSEIWTGWRWLKMMPKLNIPPPMDLPSESLILSLNISPSKHICKASQQMATRNNAVTETNCAVGEREWVGPMLRSKIISKIFLTSVPKERKLPPLKNKPWKWCCQPSTTTPCNTTQLSTKTDRKSVV